MKFKDRNNREWTFDITPKFAERCKDETGIDLTKVLSKKKKSFAQKMNTRSFIKLLDDPALLFAIMAILLQDQITEVGIDFKQFGDSIAGKEITADATEALILGIIEMSPQNERDGLQTEFKKLWAASK